MPNVRNAAIVPSSAQAIADGSGRVTTPWQRFFNALVSPAAPIQPVTLTGSPFSYRAGSAGSVAVSGGTVSAISITRGTTTIPTGATSGTFPVANGDTVAITYTVAPTVSFIPA
jgi:hypothetical protein